MYKIKVKNNGLEGEVRHPEDVERMQGILIRAGWVASPKEIEHLWDAYSDEYCAGWLMIEDYPDSSLLDILIEMNDKEEKN